MMSWGSRKGNVTNEPSNTNLKPIRFQFTGGLFNPALAELPEPRSFACYNCGKPKRSKRNAAATDYTGASVRICLECSELYVEALVKSMIDRVIVPALVRKFLDSPR
jgi:hypothetical protein